MRAALVATAALLWSCASPTLKEYEGRVERSRGRLAAIAKAQFEKNPNDERMLLTYTALAGELPADVIEREDTEMGPLGAIVLVQATLWPVPGQTWTTPSAEEASMALDELESTFPESSLVPLYRLKWLELSTTGDRAFWKECRTLLQAALDRDHWESPVQGFLVHWMDWLEGHEPDEFVRASIDIRLSDKHLLPFLWLVRLVNAALYSPVPPDPLILEVSRLLQEVCERRQKAAPALLEFMIIEATLDGLLPALFLALWRTGDRAGAKEVAKAFDLHLRVAACKRSFSNVELERYEAKIWLFNVGLHRFMGGLTGMIKARKDERDAKAQEAISSLVDTVSDEDLKREACRRLEEGAREYLANLREDIVTKEPILNRIMRFSPAGKPAINALHWVLRDEEIVDGKAIPAERQTEILERAFGSADYIPDCEGLGPYEWLLKEALIKADSVSTEALKSSKTGGLTDKIDHAMILALRGEPFEMADLESAIDYVKENVYPNSMKGYCQLLAFQTNGDRTKAAVLLPDYDRSHFEAGWAMIGETLRSVTGQDFGFDLDAWKKWLLGESEE